MASPDSITADELQAGVASTSAAPTSSKSAPSVTVHYREPDSPECNKKPPKFPIYLESVTTLEFIGLTHEAAKDIFDRYTDRLNRLNASSTASTLLEFVHRQADRVYYQLALDHPDCTPREAMTKLGCADELQDAILDPRHAGVCGTETNNYWVKDTFKLRYLWLKDEVVRVVREVQPHPADTLFDDALLGTVGLRERMHAGSTAAPDQNSQCRWL